MYMQVSPRRNKTARTSCKQHNCKVSHATCVQRWLALLYASLAVQFARAIRPWPHFNSTLPLEPCNDHMGYVDALPAYWYQS